MKWSGVCVWRGGGVFVLVDILRERESNMGGCSGRLRYLKKENLELMNKLLTLKKDGEEGENDGRDMRGSIILLFLVNLKSLIR